MRDAALADELGSRCRNAGLSTAVRHGMEALVEMAAHPDVHTVMAAIVGAAGLEPTLAAAKAGKKILLANKEVLVMAGEPFMHAVREHGAGLLPVDSEHNAIFQSLPTDFSRGLSECGVRRILLTASGGPFRTTPRTALANVTPEAACAHPNWVMGPKISVDSASMMNKGLEVIEARPVCSPVRPSSTIQVGELWDRRRRHWWCRGWRVWVDDCGECVDGAIYRSYVYCVVTYRWRRSILEPTS